VLVAPVRLEGNEPATIDQNFGRADGALSIADGLGAVDMDVARGDGRRAAGLRSRVVARRVRRVGLTNAKYARLKSSSASLYFP
jgi:hypothetical protein